MTHGYAYAMPCVNKHIFPPIFYLSSTALQISAWNNMSPCQRWLAALCRNYKAEGEDKDRLPSYAHPALLG